MASPRDVTPKNRILEIFFKHPSIIYRWKAENKSSISVKEIIEIDEFLSELWTYEGYDATGCLKLEIFTLIAFNMT